MKNIIIFALLAGLTACTNNPNPEVVNRESSVSSSGDGNFGVVPYGKAPIKSFVFKNNGPNTVVGPAAVIGSGFDIALQLGCESVEVGKSCSVKVMFNSLNKESGAYSADLKLGDSTVSLNSSIESVPTTEYEMSVDGQLATTSNLDLGNLVGSNIKIMTVKVKNKSPKAGQVSNFSVSNNRFKIFNNSCVNVLLKPNKTCSVKLVFQGDNSNSSVSAELGFDGLSKQISLSQVEQVLTGQMIAVNSSVTLGDFYQEGTNKIQLLKIQNQGDGVGKVESSSIILPPGYSIGSNNCSNVRSGASCYIRLVYSSQELGKGSHSDTVTIGDGDVDLIVNQVTNPNDLQSLNLTVAENIPVNECSPVSISLKDSENLDFVSSQPLTISSSSIFYTDDNCLTEDSLVIPSFESSKNVFIKKQTSGPISLSVDVRGKNESKSLFFYNPLILNTNKANIFIGQQAQISVGGGRGPFTVEIVSGGGILTVGGTYTSDTVGLVNFKVTDTALNKTATASLNVVGVLTTAVTGFEKIVNQNQNIQGQNGLAPYVYTKISGVGSIDSNTGLYTAGAVAGSVQLKITDALNQEVLVNGQIYTELGVTPLSKVIISTGNHQISPTGGKTPYSFFKTSGDGSVNSTTGLFSSATATTSQIKVQDALGQEQTVSVQVVLPLTANISTFEKLVNQTQNIQGQNGLTPYVYSKVSGVGNINSSSGVYSSGTTAGPVQLKITDALNQEVLVSGTIYELLTVTNYTTAVGISKQLVPTGGKAPYVYNRISGVGDVSSTGLYLSNLSGSAVIKVQDALGQEISSNILVNSTLSLSAGTCSYSTPEQVNCQVQGSGGIGSLHYSTDSGVVDANTGSFYGICQNNLGQSQVTVVDDYGNSSSVTLNYPCVYTSCNSIKATVPGVASGQFWLDTDAHRTGNAPFLAYCDNSQEQGGWTLVAKYGNTSANNYHWFLSNNGTLGLNNSFVNDIQVSAKANLLVTRASEIKINFASDFNTYFTINNLTASKNYLWSGTPINDALGYMSRKPPVSNYASANYRTGAVIRMHYGTYNGGYGSGLTTNVGSNQNLTTISNCTAYCSYRLPGIGTTPGTAWGLEYGFLQVYVKETTGLSNPYPVSCLDAKNKGTLNQAGTLSSGVWTIDPDGPNSGLAPFDVVCDQETDNGGWTVVQQRRSSSDFYRTWEEYKAGFGTIANNGNYWLGLDRINALAPTSAPKAIYFKLKRLNGQTAYAKYSSFSLDNEIGKYKMAVSGFSGTAGNSFGGHNGYNFTTKDVDNDVSGDNCAVTFKGAWWYSSCHDSNLNGIYYGGAHSSYADGVNWSAWTGYYEALTETTMMVK